MKVGRRLAVDRPDQVARADAGARGETARIDLGHEDADGVLDVITANAFNRDLSAIYNMPR